MPRRFAIMFPKSLRPPSDESPTPPRDWPALGYLFVKTTADRYVTIKEPLR